MKLDQLKVRDFIKELGSAAAAPGGGSVAALCGALGASLSAMVSRLTTGKEQFTENRQVMEELTRKADKLADRFLALVQEDTDAYQDVIAALRLPRDAKEQAADRQASLEQAMKRAAAVPLETLRASEDLMHMAKTAVEQGNPIAITDAGAGVHLARVAGAIAAYNVRINIARITDLAFTTSCATEANEVLQRLEAICRDMDAYIDSHLA